MTVGFRDGIQTGVSESQALPDVGLHITPGEHQAEESTVRNCLGPTFSLESERAQKVSKDSIPSDWPVIHNTSVKPG